MDKRKSILNISVSVGLKVVAMLFVIVVKRLLIQFCGNEVNGLNSLYLSIIGFLAVAELGVGSAISFCMYKPIVEGDIHKVSALYHLFRKLYLGIGGIILVGGLILTPFVPFFAKDYAQLQVDFYSTFILMLISVVLTYGFGAKTALINAYKNNYITVAISFGGLILQYVLQSAVLILTKSFIWYLVCRIVIALGQWLITNYVAKKKYAPIMAVKQSVDDQTKKELVKNIKAMFMHKIGFLLVNTVDSIIISVFVGVVTLGIYSNYTTILASLTSVLTLVFTSLTSVIGHLYVEENKNHTQKYCEAFHVLNFVLAMVVFLGYYAVIDHLIAIFFSPNLIAAKSIVWVVTLNGFVQFMRQSTLVFRDATGTFYHDRWKPLAEGLSNLVLSILFVQWIGVTGVIVATIITNLVICHIVEPWVLYKNAFGTSPVKYYVKNYVMMALFSACLVLMDLCKQEFESHWKAFFTNGVISVGISALVCVVVLCFNQSLTKHLLKVFKQRLKK